MGKIKNKVKTIKGGIIYRLYHDLRWMYAFYNKYIGRIVMYALVEMVHMAVDFAITYKIGSLVDFALDNNTEKTIFMTIVYITLFVSNALLSIAANRFAAWNYNSMRSEMVKRLYNKLLMKY